jgi:hypothetical protein
MGMSSSRKSSAALFSHVPATVARANASELTARRRPVFAPHEWPAMPSFPPGLRSERSNTERCSHSSYMKSITRLTRGRVVSGSAEIVPDTSGQATTNPHRARRCSTVHQRL